MKKYALLILITLSFFSFGFSQKPAITIDPNLTKVISTSINSFAFDLYSEVKKQDGNLFFSPYSISSALAMTYGGAKGNTRKQMAKVLHFIEPQEKLHSSFGKLQSYLNSIQRKGNIKLAIANSLWIQKGYKLLKSFLNLTKKNYDAGINLVDFVKQPEGSRQKINQWVENKTNDKIKDLIQPGVITPLTRLILANAIYFKGNWLSQFEKEKTKDMPFYVNPAKEIKVPMMHQTEEFKYMENELIQMLELSYQDNLSMLIILPIQAKNLEIIEDSLSPENLSDWIGSLNSVEVRVYIPKFNITCQLGLAEILKSMGMKDPFAMNADFSGIDGTKELRIDAVIHKAFVDVNEKGTEAAASTAVTIGVTAIPRCPPPLFKADHPFIFLIREDKTGTILFIGRVSNPE